MPEAAVNEHRDFASCEHDVRPYADTVRQVKPVIFAVAVAEPMQLSA